MPSQNLWKAEKQLRNVVLLNVCIQLRLTTKQNYFQVFHFVCFFIHAKPKFMESQKVILIIFF